MVGNPHYARCRDSALGLTVADAICAIDLPRALEWLEAEAKHPCYANTLRACQLQLQQSSNTRDLNPNANIKTGDPPDIATDIVANAHRKAAIQYENILKEIRNCNGFEDFLRPKTLPDLLPPPELVSGPVVFINVFSSRCDALVLSADGTITAVALPKLSLERVEELRRRWTIYLAKGWSRTRGLGSLDKLAGDMNPLNVIFECLWTCIAQPILDALDLIIPDSTGRLPHITWCPTGPLTQLPLHAAGCYDDPDGPRIYHFVVSSYTPSLLAFARACKGVSQLCSTPDVLIVTQPDTPDHTPLPGTVYEGARLQEILSASQIPTMSLSSKDATVNAVRSVMSRHRWVHFACHGSQDAADVTRSAFALYDGPLSLSDLMQTVADNAELAFLSACQTAVGDEKLPEESAHLAAGMLAVGFKGVIATMWSIRDDDAPVVVEAFYQKLLALQSAGEVGKGETGAAYALDEATRVLREKVGESNFLRWVPFVHFGV